MNFNFENRAVVAVAVSGGPDSMALLHLLHQAAPGVIALTVDHGLRAESLAEAKSVAAWCKKNKIKHHILPWRGKKPKSALQESARVARYGLLQKFCSENNILHLATAHHADDQAETILQRIAKASGPQGLIGISEHSFLPHAHVWRPLLDHTKSDLIKYCEAFKIPFVRDPSNDNTNYTRGRLRQATDVLAAEGLTGGNLNLLAHKQRDANIALENQTAAFLARHAKLYPSERTEISATEFAQQPAAIQHMALDYVLKLTSDQHTPIRYNSLANLCRAITAPNFRAKTLGHCRIQIKRINRRSSLMITPEAAP